MSILVADELYKTIGEKTLFDGISFTIEPRQRIGLIGVNGTGKSSLLKGLAGVEGFEKGKITHAKDMKIEYLPQEPDLDEDKTVLDQIFTGDAPVIRTLREYERAQRALELNPSDPKAQENLLARQQQMDEQNAWEAGTLARTVLSQLGVQFYDQKVAALSGGQKKRVAIARALIQPADLLILDEPTNHLDQAVIEWLEEYLATYPGAIILVTHDRYVLNRVCNLIFELDKGKLFTYEGNYETFLAKKAEREELEAKNETKRQNTLRRELAWLKRGPKARGTKQKARTERAHALKEQEGPAKKQEVEFAVGSKRLGKKVIEAEETSLAFSGDPIIKDFSYLVVPDERLGIIGPNGAGKTTLLDLLSRRLSPDEGTVTHGETVHLGYYSQEQEDLDQNKRVLEYIREIKEVVQTADGREITAEQMLERFLFGRDVQWSYIKRLSGGERRRLYLLSVLMQEPNVLFLDEPTNDLDTETLSVLEDYLEQFPGVVITVSHDRYFLDRTVDHLLVLDRSGQVKRFTGNYTDYLESQKTEAPPSVQKQASDNTGNHSRQKRKKKLSYKEQQEYNGIEDRIDELEQTIEKIDKQIAEAGSDFETIQSLQTEKEELEATLERTMERWEELEAKLTGEE
ncbi:ABC-F family ATP-binding cassette domain-containing protein [Salsuginibacillus kocurii]|uniref:ABC-F family ATP-binding cassette domain-containing protein n=1 Tax=Salsuginibacillus kocurii TaxID=427078 RepID=UPI000370410A|nr:ABC-F family ATP-binding cassette domain-containing protein [Salsuginibacillus kocurii]